MLSLQRIVPEIIKEEVKHTVIKVIDIIPHNIKLAKAVKSLSPYRRD